MKQLYLLIFLITLGFSGSSQDDYTPIHCEGSDIPEEFIAYTSDKIARANAQYKGKKQTELSKKEFSEYNTSTHFYVDYLLKNGMIVFGTSMNSYVDKVGAHVLQFFPEIKDTVRFYIVKSPSVNAFTTQQGIIFINIGLIAQLENEAQLAYVISHELIHYKYKHSFKSYQEQIKANSDWGNYGKLNNDSKKGLLLQYSRSNEYLADSLGFIEGYSKTKYSYDEALNVFDVLLYSNLPFDEIEFDTAYFDDDNFKMDPKYILHDVDLVSNPEDYDDSEMTHPNIKKRRNVMINLVTGYDNPNKAKYLVSEEEFLNLQREARFEMSNLYISNLQYDKAFYNSYLLLRKYPNNKYLKKTMAYCIYSIAVHKKIENVNRIIQSYSKMEGQSQRVNYFFKKASSKTLSSLSVKYLWNYHKEYPNDAYMNLLLTAALKLQIEEVKIKYADIYTPIVKLDTIQTTDTTLLAKKNDFKVLTKEEYEDLSKYDKIRYDKKYEQYFGLREDKVKRTSVKTKNYLRILSSEKNDPAFKKMYLAAEGDDEEVEEVIAAVMIDEMMMVNPLYYKIKNEDIVVMGTEEKEASFSQSFKDMAKRRNIDMKTIDILDVKHDDVNMFNDLALLNSWLSEYEDLSELERMDIMIPWQTNYLDSLRVKYNLRYISTGGLLEFEGTQPVNSRVRNIIYAAVIWQASPYYLSKAVKNYRKVYHFFYCVDLETNDLIVNETAEIDGKATNDFMNSLNYNAMYKLKPKK